MLGKPTADQTRDRNWTFDKPLTRDRTASQARREQGREPSQLAYSSSDSEDELESKDLPALLPPHTQASPGIASAQRPDTPSDHPEADAEADDDAEAPNPCRFNARNFCVYTCSILAVSFPTVAMAAIQKVLHNINTCQHQHMPAHAHASTSACTPPAHASTCYTAVLRGRFICAGVRNLAFHLALRLLLDLSVL